MTASRKIAFAAGAIAFFALATGPAQSSPLVSFPLLQAPAQAAPQIEEDEVGSVETPARLKRQIVSYAGAEAPGTVVVDTPNTHLYFVLGGGKAIRYGIGVGREGFTWSGVQSISRKAEWPDWHPPADMLARQPYLPRFMAGGASNPLGARAMYLGGTVYRIHGTNNPSTIGGRVSSGCIRMTNEDVTDLYSRVTVGTKVVVKPMDRRAAFTDRVIR
jgi:lipoprotein-anchoring transpeptidase ErfK/SrfK